MTSRLAARVFGALFFVAAPVFGPLSGLAYAQTPDAYDVEALPAVAAPPAVAPTLAAPVPKRVSTGACVILKGEQIVDQQNCKALAAAEDTAVNGSAAAGFANGITYVWPSGNRTIIGGADDDFSVNGNACRAAARCQAAGFASWSRKPATRSVTRKAPRSKPRRHSRLFAPAFRRRSRPSGRRTARPLRARR